MLRFSMIERPEHPLPRRELSGHHGPHRLARFLPLSVASVWRSTRVFGAGPRPVASAGRPDFRSLGDLGNLTTRGVTYAGFLSIGLGSGADGDDKVSDHLRVHTTWCENEVWRNYWEPTTHTGLLCVVSHDLLTDKSYLERVYD